MKRTIPVLGLLLATVFVLFGAAQAQNDRLLIGSSSEISGFDPRVATDVPSLERINVIMEGLVAFDRSLGLRPRLATEWETGDDGLTMTFTLRQGVTFHHGRAFTSEDVRHTFETLLDPAFGAPNRSLYVAIASIDTPDDSTVVLNLSTPNAFLLNDLARLPIIPADLGEDSDAFNQRPSGTGPYQFDTWVRDDRLVLSRFDDYWGGAGELAFLEFRVIPENTTRLLAFGAGEIDVTQGQLPPAEIDRLVGDPQFNVDRTPGTGYTYLAFNVAVEPLDDVRVRQALNHLIPRQDIVERVMNDNAFPGISMLLPTMPWFNPNVTRFDYDPERARALLEEAGVDFAEPFRLYTNDNAARKQIAEILAMEFSQVGLTLEINIEEFGAVLQRVQQTDDFDMFILGWGGQLDPDRATIRQFHSGDFGTANYTGYANPRVDELLERGFRTDPTSQESIDIYQEISAIVVEESPYAFVFYTEETGAYHPWIGGWTVHPYSPNTYQDAHLITKSR